LATTNILKQLFIEQILNNWERVARFRCWAELP